MTYEANKANTCGVQAITELIILENQDHVEDKLVSLCDELAKDDISTVEIASGLLFTLHYILCQQETKDVQQCYDFLLNQCRKQIEALHEFYEIS